jgi:hypothetical protein
MYFLHRRNRAAPVGLEKMNRFDERAHEPLDNTTFALNQTARRRESAGGRKKLQFNSVSEPQLVRRQDPAACEKENNRGGRNDTDSQMSHDGSTRKE